MKKRKKIFILTAMLLLSFQITASAVSYSYSSISLPAFSGNWTSPNRTKTTNDNYFYHYLQSLGGSYQYVDAWQIVPIYGNTPEVTYKSTFKEGEADNIYWYEPVVTNVNTMLRLENSDWVYVDVEATGTYDLR